MTAVLRQADSILRGRSAGGRDPFGAGELSRLALLIVIFGMAYGAVMGTFSASTLQRTLQVLYSAVKVPLLLGVTFCVSMPSFFVINTLMGLRQDFAAAMRALITGQAALTIILASLAPLTGLWYASVPDYNVAILFNATMFAIASITAQFLLRRLYQPLIDRNPRHRILLRLWLLIYIFVGIQMGWVLRPFVGSPTSPTRFFREGAFTNAYEYVAKLIWNVFAG